MKNKIFFQGLLLLGLLIVGTVVNSCKKEDDCPTVDYTALDQSISEAQQIHDNAVEGTEPGEYPPPAKNDFQLAIDLAQSVRSKNCVTQQELDNAKEALTNALTVFESKKIPDCPDVDYTEIDQTIADAQQIHDNAAEGTEPGMYPPPAKYEFQQAIDTALSVRNKECVTQQELNNARGALLDAVAVFESQIIPECPVVDYTQIDQAIADAQQIHDNAIEGTAPGEYPPPAKYELQQAIDIAQAVRDTYCVTQQELNDAAFWLNNAVENFESKIIPDFSQNLIAHWLFNGDGNDATGNGHDATMHAGHANWGGGMPEPAEDRHGNENYCYKFVDGGNFVVPQNNAFIPAEITISVWMNLYESWPHNFFLSNDIWHSWKFQVQEANKPFFTAHILKDDGSGEEAWIDHDSNFADLDLNTWHHVVLTYTSGKMIFYIDGEEVHEWDDFPTGTLIEPHEGIDLCIGQALPTAGYELPDHQWEEWLGYFKGYMDDMRFYNTILTEAQVQTLYQYERDNTITE